MKRGAILSLDVFGFGPVPLHNLITKGGAISSLDVFGFELNLKKGGHTEAKVSK
jgi:hypothetical protein